MAKYQLYSRLLITLDGKMLTEASEVQKYDGHIVIKSAVPAAGPEVDPTSLTGEREIKCVFAYKEELFRCRLSSHGEGWKANSGVEQILTFCIVV